MEKLALCAMVMDRSSSPAGGVEEEAGSGSFAVVPQPARSMALITPVSRRDKNFFMLLFSFFDLLQGPPLGADCLYKLL